MGTGLKENRNSWLARAIVTLLALTFIVGLGYTGGFGGGPSAGVALTVNGDPVPFSYYQVIRQNVYNSQTAEADRVTLEMQDAITRYAIAIIVERKLLAQRARALGLRMPDSNIHAAVVSNPSFQLDGEFAGPDYYKRVVEAGMGMTVSQFEDALRDEYLASKMLEIARASSSATELELESLIEAAGNAATDEFKETVRAAVEDESGGEGVRVISWWITELRSGADVDLNEEILR